MDTVEIIIVYLSCTDNNRAVTVFNCFRQAILRYDLLSMQSAVRPWW